MTLGFKECDIFMGIMIESDVPWCACPFVSKAINPLRSNSNQCQISLCQRPLSRRSHENEGYDHPTLISLVDQEILTSISDVWQ